MSRISYSEEEDYEGQFALFRANLGRSLAGKKGQAALKDLRAALLALPEKRLIPYRLSRKGEVCTTGALLAHKMESLGMAREAALQALADDSEGCANLSCGHTRAKHQPDCRPCAEWAAGKGATWDAKPCPAWQEPDADAPPDEDDVGVPEEFGKQYGIPRMVIWRLVELNDIELDYVTPEERYARVLAWATHAVEDPTWVERDARY